MDGPAVQVIESATDLTPVLEDIELLVQQLDALQVSVLVMCGVVLGAMVICVLAVMFR